MSLLYGALLAAVLLSFVLVFSTRSGRLASDGGTFETVIVPSSSMVDAWAAIYNQASATELENSKVYVTLAGAMLIASTTAMGFWPGLTLPIISTEIMLFAQIAAIIPLAGTAEYHRKRMGSFLASNDFSKALRSGNVILALPRADIGRGVRIASTFVLLCAGFSVALLVVQAFIISTSSCTEILNGFKLCPPDK